MSRAVAVVCVALLLVACGNKGALYLPDESAPKPITPSAQAPDQQQVKKQ